LHIDESDKISYEPTTSNINNRTHTRLLKGRIDRTSHDVDCKCGLIQRINLNVRMVLIGHLKALSRSWELAQDKPSN